MKKTICLISAFILILAISISAHPGRTDANGGHWNRETGEYHFHTGEYAGKGSSGSSSPKEDEPLTPPYEPPTENPYKQADSTPSSDEKLSFGDVITYILAFLLFILPAIPFLFMVVASICETIYDTFLKKLLPQYKITKFNEKLNKLKEHRQEKVDIIQKLNDLKNQIQIPEEYEIGSDNLPKEKNCTSGWGQTFTLYKTSKGAKLHAKYNCCFATHPVHICQYTNHRFLHRNVFSDFLCSKCVANFSLPDISWYENYLDYEQAKRKLLILEKTLLNLQKEVATLHRKCNSLIFKTVTSFSRKNTHSLNAANNLYKELNQKT